MKTKRGYNDEGMPFGMGKIKKNYSSKAWVPKKVKHLNNEQYHEQIPKAIESDVIEFKNTDEKELKRYVDKYESYLDHWEQRNRERHRDFDNE